MDKSFAIVITSILKETRAIEQYSGKCSDGKYKLITIGDKKAPDKINIKNCNYYSLKTQKKLPYKFASKCPVNNYARKNIGYLEAVRSGFNIIVETDDDNYPLKSFWDTRKLNHNPYEVNNKGWVNVYKYFTDENIWPRGFPLQKLDILNPKLPEKLSSAGFPIQQGLVDRDPDVDAVYRMTIGKKINFIKDKNVVLGKNVWCPFNSQNTTWFKEAYPLMYLPTYCNMRLTDIWRGFIAQRIAWTCGWNILFHSPNAYQDRNEHNLLNDFCDEMKGYIHNDQICNELNDMDLKTGNKNIYENMVRCYKLMIKNKWIGKKELNLLELWINDLITFS